jgi:two-component system response regulator CpxR
LSGFFHGGALHRSRQTRTRSEQDAQMTSFQFVAQAKEARQPAEMTGGPAAAPLITSVLLVDDDVGMGQMLAEYLAGEQMNVRVVHDGWMANELLQVPDHGYELLVLDVTLPGQNGFDILKRLRHTSTLPVIMLTARGSEIDRIVGLELGADDYLPKPFNPRELVARMRAVLRRHGERPAAGAAAGTASAGNGAQAGAAPGLPYDEPQAGALQVGGLRYHPRSLEADAGAGLVRLTGTEARVLEILMRSVGRMIGREQLTLWALGRKLQAQDRSLDTHVSNLRRKLGLTAGADGLPELRSVRGLGYLLTQSSADAA